MSKWLVGLTAVVALILAVSLVGCREGETPTPTLWPVTASPSAEPTSTPSSTVPTLTPPISAPSATPTPSATASPAPELKGTVLVPETVEVEGTVLVPVTAEVEKATPSNS